GPIVPAYGATNPSSVVARVFEVRVAANSDCTGAISIYKTASPTPVDFIATPTLAVGAVPNGTYHCIAVQLSDVINVTPQADDGANCHAGVAFDQDIFTAGPESISYSPGGTLIHGTGSAS